MNNISTENTNEPIYDERVIEILDALSKKVTMQELAKRYGHTNAKTNDIYMRRRNFRWDSNKMTYVPKLQEQALVPERVMPTTKTGMIIEMMKNKSFDIDEVCHKVGFKDHRQLAEYMSEKGYQWSPAESNYKRVNTPTLDEKLPIIIPTIQKETSVPIKSTTKSDQLSHDTSLIRFLPLLEELDTYRDKLLELIKPSSKNDTLPRYVIPGRTSGKTIQMAEPLQDMAVQYCNERNIKQRELFEMALIEFLKRNGYDYEVANLMRTY
jgi:hypothetical protein